MKFLVFRFLCDLQFCGAGNSQSKAAVQRLSILLLVGSACGVVSGHPLRVFGSLTEVNILFSSPYFHNSNVWGKQGEHALLL